MAEGKRIYEIKINGLTESYEGVKSLKEALDTLTDTVVNVSKQEEKSTASKKESKSATDALSKAQEKLNNWDKEYQTELAKTNAELSNNKKEINATIKVQQAQEVVDAKQLDTYAQKQQYLSALNTLIRNHSTATEEDRAAIDGMVRESAALQAELKATDEQMKIYVRNVGNYPGAVKEVVESHKSLKSELKDLKAQMSEMLASGVSKTDEAYLKLAERAGFLKDAIKDANEDITNFASDTRGLTNAINLASSAVSAYQLYNSALQVFGDENEEAAKSIQKMMSVMTLLNSLQTVQNNLLENGSATARLYSKAVELIQAALGIKKTAVEENIAVTEAATVAEETNTVAQEMNATASEANATSRGIATTAETTNTGAITANTTATEANTVATNSMSVAQKAGAVASNILSVALRAIPLMAVIGLVMALIQNWESIWNWFKKTFPVLDNLSKKFNKLGGFMNAIVTGAKAVGAAVVNWLINPFKTFADVIGKILSGDFAGAWDAALNGIKNQFKGTADAFKNEVVKGYAKGQEEMTAKNATESNKRTKQELEELKIQERNNKTYSKKYIELQKKDFEERRKMAKGNKEELDKIKLEEMKFDAEVEDKKTAYAKSQANERSKNAKAASAAAKAAAAQAKKEAEEAEKKRQKLIEDTQKVIDNIDKQVAATDDKILKLSDKRYSESIKQYAEYGKLFGKAYVEMSRLMTSSEEAMDKLQLIMESAFEDGTEELQNTVSRYYRESAADYAYAKDMLQQYEKGVSDTINQSDHFVSRRREIAANQIAIDAQKLKDEYLTQIGELDKFIEQLSKKTDDESKKQLEKAEKARDRAVKAMEKELGFYAKKENKIEIPVNVNFESIETNFNKLRGDLEKKGKAVSFTFQDALDAALGVNGTLEKIYKKSKDSNELYENFRDLANVLGLVKGKTIEENEELDAFLKKISDNRPFEQKKKELHDFFNTASLDVSKFGTFSQEVINKFKQVDEETIQTFNSVFNSFVAEQDKIISFSEKAIRRFQDATRDIKFEPVMQDDSLSKWFEGQILNIDKTKERYANLKRAYHEYQETIKVGSETMQKYEEAWQQKLNASKNQMEFIGRSYGENSEQYKNAVMDYELLTKEKEKADAAYAIEREKVSKQIEEIQKKENKIMSDYFQSLHDRMSSIYSSISENMFQPLAEGFGALLEFQLEEAKEALENVTELYDKAVEAREESAERMKQINDELKADDGQNKEALQQRLAEEEVLLVQREEQERALAKEKEKREKEVEKKEKQQRKMELGQKLIEGIVNTALGVTAALKWGFPLGPVFAAVVGAMGALQTALIAKKISKLEKGGKVGEKGISRSHKQGGHRIEDTNIEVEGQEWVINKKSSQKYDTLLRAINEDNPRLVRREIEIIREKQISRNTSTPFKRIFADGGRINTINAVNAVRENNEIAAITDLIKQIDFQPTVAVTDINKVNKNLVRVQQYAGKSA